MTAVGIRRTRRASETRARLAAFGLVLAACTRPSPPVDASPSGSASAAPSAAPSASAAGAQASPFWLGDGCHAGVGTSGDVATRAAKTRLACAPGAELLAPQSRIQPPGKVELSLGKEAGCVRLIAVADHVDSDVTVELVDSGGSVLEKDALSGSVAMIGPVCFATETSFEARVGLGRGSGDVLFSAHRMR